MLSPEPPVCTFGEIKGGTKSKSADSLGCQVAESGRRLVVLSGGESAVAAGLLVWDQRWGKNWVWTLSDAHSRTSAEGRSHVPRAEGAAGSQEGKEVPCHFWDLCDGDISIRSIDAPERVVKLDLWTRKRKRLLAVDAHLDRRQGKQQKDHS